MAWALPDIYSVPMPHGNSRGRAKTGPKPVHTVEDWAARVIDRAGERAFIVVIGGDHGVKPCFEGGAEFLRYQTTRTKRLIGVYDCRVKAEALADDVRDLWRLA